MAAPTVCDLTFPTDGWVTGAGPDGNATIGCDVTTDPSTPVQFLLDGNNYGDPVTSDGNGLAELDVEFPIGVRTIQARAGVDPDFTESEVHQVVVQDMIDSIGDPSNRSSRWYLAYLAGFTVINIPDSALPVMRFSACTWASIDPANYGTVAALNIKAGITDPSAYKPINACLNLIAYATDNLDECSPWLTDQQALYKICQEA